ncbi:MAG: hypothetical protein RLW61_20945 [Gammaproteobacteria bacterium]
MARITSGHVELREVIARNVAELEHEYPERHSTAWFFLRYLKRVQRHAEGPSARGCDRAMRALTRFYVDMDDAETDLARRFDEVYFTHRNAVVLERRAEDRARRRLG